jgi:hypothetical protein
MAQALLTSSLKIMKTKKMDITLGMKLTNEGALR